MTNTEFPADQGKDRDYIALERKVADLANALASGGARFVTGDLIPHWTSTREGAVLCDGTIYLDTDPLIGEALAAMLRAGGFFTDGTHVQVPDYRGQVLGGVGGSLGALGAPVGVSTVTLTAAESGLPAHTTAGPSTPNTSAGTSHTHGVGAGTQFVEIAAGAIGFATVAGALSITQSANTGAEAAHTHTLSAHTHTVTAAPAANAHNNIQPTLPAYIFIKT